MEACFSAAVKAEFHRKLAEQDIHRKGMLWVQCTGLARDAARQVKALESHQGEPQYVTPLSTPPQAQQQAPLRTQLPVLPPPASSQGGSAEPVYVYPRQNSEWVRTHKSDLRSFRVCNKFLNQVPCDAPGCTFRHELPDRIDIASAEWQKATAQAAEYRASRRAANQAREQASQSAVPGAAPAPVPQQAASYAAVVGKVQTTAELDDIDDELCAKLDAQLTLKERGDLTARGYAISAVPADEELPPEIPGMQWPPPVYKL